jgi:hypothetical protein
VGEMPAIILQLANGATPTANDFMLSPVSGVLENMSRIPNKYLVTGMAFTFKTW